MYSQKSFGRDIGKTHRDREKKSIGIETKLQKQEDRKDFQMIDSFIFELTEYICIDDRQKKTDENQFV